MQVDACLFCGRPIGGAHKRIAGLYCSPHHWRRQEYAIKRLRDSSPPEAREAQQHEALREA